MAITLQVDGDTPHAEFEDSYRQRCLISDSALVHVRPILWLGVTRDRQGAPVSPMWLNQETAAALLPLLQRFVETGSIEPQKEQTDAK